MYGKYVLNVFFMCLPIVMIVWIITMTIFKCAAIPSGDKAIVSPVYPGEHLTALKEENSLFVCALYKYFVFLDWIVNWFY